MKFSQRKGYLKPSDVIQKKGMNEDLRISLWNALDMLVWQRRDFLWTQNYETGMSKFSKALCSVSSRSLLMQDPIGRRMF